MLGAGRDRRQAALPLGASSREEATSWDPHLCVMKQDTFNTVSHREALWGVCHDS